MKTIARSKGCQSADYRSLDMAAAEAVDGEELVGCMCPVCRRGDGLWRQDGPVVFERSVTLSGAMLPGVVEGRL
jgi:hypothetical protein